MQRIVGRMAPAVLTNHLPLVVNHNRQVLEDLVHVHDVRLKWTERIGVCSPQTEAQACRRGDGLCRNARERSPLAVWCWFLSPWWAPGPPQWWPLPLSGWSSGPSRLGFTGTQQTRNTRSSICGHGFMISLSFHLVCVWDATIPHRWRLSLKAMLMSFPHGHVYTLWLKFSLCMCHFTQQQRLFYFSLKLYIFFF